MHFSTGVRKCAHKGNNMNQDQDRLVAQVPVELKKAIEHAAKQQRRSVAKQIQIILEEWLEKQKP
jgi:hypothetical protein